MPVPRARLCQLEEPPRSRPPIGLTSEQLPARADVVDDLVVVLDPGGDERRPALVAQPLGQLVARRSASANSAPTALPRLRSSFAYLRRITSALGSEWNRDSDSAAQIASHRSSEPAG